MGNEADREKISAYTLLAKMKNTLVSIQFNSQEFDGNIETEAGKQILAVIRRGTPSTNKKPYFVYIVAVCEKFTEPCFFSFLRHASKSDTPVPVGKKTYRIRNYSKIPNALASCRCSTLSSPSSSRRAASNSITSTSWLRGNNLLFRQ